MARLISAGKRAELRQLFCRVFITIGFLSIAVSLTLVLLGSALIDFWVGEGLAPRKSVLAAFAVWSVYWLVATQFSFVLNAAGQVWRQALSTLLMAAVSVPVSFQLTGQLGVTGPIIGSLICHLIFVMPMLAVSSFRVLRAPDEGLGLARSYSSFDRRA
jgi:O-antigen/teichoic acid export membrane protein